MIPKHFLIVGAGFAGSVCARILAEAGRSVQIIDRREHVGGISYDQLDSHGVLVHTYGPHIFHTRNAAVFALLSRFTEWRSYEHRALAVVGEEHVPVPVNRTTINRLFRLNLRTKEEVRAHLDRVRMPRAQLLTSEDVVLDAVGPELCDKLFRGYTRKQWGVDLSTLSASVLARIPVRTDDDDRYFTDPIQYMPAQGYTPLFNRLLDHPGIRLQTCCEYRARHRSSTDTHLIYTGPIDEYFNCCYGRLPYRSLRFEHEQLPGVPKFQPVAVMIYPEHPTCTRISEFKHMTGQEHTGTSILREHPQADGAPYYPVPCPESDALYARYAALAAEQRSVSFVGRLAQYRYYNMDQVVEEAMQTAKRLLTGAT